MYKNNARGKGLNLLASKAPSPNVWNKVPVKQAPVDEYEPSPESEESSEDLQDYSGAGGAFALLAIDHDEAQQDEWFEVKGKNNKKKPVPAPALPIVRAPPAAGTRVVAGHAGGSSNNNSNGSNGRQPVPAAFAPRQPNGKPVTHTADGKPINTEYYKAFQQVFKNERGDVALRFHKTEIVTVKPSGDIVLWCNGFTTFTTFLSMNDALKHINVKIKSVGSMASGDWTVVDEYGTYPFKDGMVIAAKSTADQNRGETLLHAMQAEGIATTTHAGPPASAKSLSRAPGLPGAPASTSPASAPAGQRPYAPTLAPNQQQHANGTGAQLARAPGQQVRPGQPYGAIARAPPPMAVPRPSANNPGQGRRDNSALAAHLFEALALKGDDIDDDHACIVCMEALRDTVIIPCGHMVLCASCCIAIVNSNKECPVCRSNVASHLTISDD